MWGEKQGKYSVGEEPKTKEEGKYSYSGEGSPTCKKKDHACNKETKDALEISWKNGRGR